MRKKREGEGESLLILVHNQELSYLYYHLCCVVVEWGELEEGEVLCWRWVVCTRGCGEAC